MQAGLAAGGKKMDTKTKHRCQSTGFQLRTELLKAKFEAFKARQDKLEARKQALLQERAKRAAHEDMPGKQLYKAN